MNRSLLLGIISTIALFSSIAIYFYFNNIKVKNRMATDAIPDDAFVIIQSENIAEAWKSFLETGLWLDLKANAAIEYQGNLINTLLANASENGELNDVFIENKTAVSLHNVAGAIGLLGVNEVGISIDLGDVAAFVAKKLNGNSRKRNFDNTSVFDITDESGNVVLSLATKEYLLMASTQPTLVEEAIRKLNYNLSESNKGFDQLNLTTDNSADCNVLINYQRISQFFSAFNKPEHAHIFQYLKYFANWSLLNLKFDKSEIDIKGVTYTDDSLFQFLDLFKNQTPKKLELQQYMPANTAFSLQMGFTDYMKFNTELNEYLQAHKKANQYAKFADSIERRYDIDISQKILSFIDGEAALMAVEPPDSDIDKNLAAIIRFKDAEGMGKALKNVVAQMSKKGENDSINYYHNGIELDRIKLGDFLKLYYGEIMEQIYSPYYARINDVFVFANNVNTLKFIIDEHKRNNTLLNSEKYKLYSTNLAQTNNINLFINPALNFLTPAKFVTENFFSTLNTHQADFKKFEYFNMQFSNTNNKAFYTQVNFKYATIVAVNQTQLLWNYKLDTTFVKPPQIVYNTKLKQHIIFVQDVKNTLYCISNSGSLIWRSKLSAPLVGSFVSVDAKKDGSNCYLFGTEKQLFLTDEDGVSLPNYPIGLPGKCLIPFTLVKSEIDTVPQLFLALDNNRIAGYYLNGKSITGYNTKKLANKLITPINYYYKGNTLMLYATTSEHNLCVINNKGKTIDFGNEIVAETFYYQTQTDTLTTVFNSIDSAGKVSKLLFDSSNVLQKIMPVAKIETGKIITQTDPVTNKMAYLIMQPTQSLLYNSLFEKTATFINTDTLMLSTYFTTDASGRTMVASNKKTTGEYYWYDVNGKLYQDFPQKGTAPFATGNLFGNQKNCLLGGDAGNNIFLIKLK